MEFREWLFFGGGGLIGKGRREFFGLYIIYFDLGSGYVDTYCIAFIEFYIEDVK